MTEDFIREYEDLKKRVNELYNRDRPAPLPYTIARTFVTTSIADNVATDVFRIETTNESGSNDGGGYSVFVHALIGHALTANASNEATKSFTAHYTRVMKGDGTGVNSAVSEISESASAATTAGTRDIGTVTMTVVENTEYQNDIQFTIDTTGTSATTATTVIYVQVLWYGFNTAPTLTGL